MLSGGGQIEETAEAQTAHGDVTHRRVGVRDARQDLNKITKL